MLRCGRTLVSHTKFNVLDEAGPLPVIRALRRYFCSCNDFTNRKRVSCYSSYMIVVGEQASGGVKLPRMLFLFSESKPAIMWALGPSKLEALCFDAYDAHTAMCHKSSVDVVKEVASNKHRSVVLFAILRYSTSSTWRRRPRRRALTKLRDVLRFQCRAL